MLRSSLAVLLLLLAVPSSAAEPDRERGARREIRVERVVTLRPLPGAEVVLPEVKAFHLSDGSVTIAGKGRARVGAPVQGFDYEVDLVRGTYTTRRLDPAEIAERQPLVESFGENRQPLPPAGDLDRIAAAVLPGTWYGRVRVQTKDPVFVVLTETTAELTWTVASAGTVAWNSYGDGCWSANPSSLGTHWFVSSCQGGAPWSPSSTRACNDNQGGYYNWDFGDANQSTTVSQWASLCGRNDAFYDYNWSHNDGGEYALLIYGSVLLG